MARFMLVLAALLSSCRQVLPLDVTEALRRCDYSTQCSRAVAAVAALDEETRESRAGMELRMLALEAVIGAIASFPSANEGFLSDCGKSPASAMAEATNEALALASMGVYGAAEASEVLAFMKAPSCAGLERLGQVRRSREKALAAMAQMSVLGQTLAAMEPHRAGFFAEVARQLVGCNLSERASPAALLVELRNRFYDLLDQCAFDTGSCERAKALARSHSMGLPLGEASSGTVVGALVPVSLRGLGISFTPPWIFVMSAGRLGVVDQVRLGPLERQVRDPPDSELMDLRAPRGPHVMQSVLHHALEKRKPWDGLGLPVAAVAVDRSTTAADLLDLLEALSSVSDAVAVAAILPEGGRLPTYYPLNYRFESRPLLDPGGGIRAFPRKGPDLTIELGPFAATVSSARGERLVSLPRDMGLPDTRDLYRAAKELAPPPQEALGTVRVVVDPAVPVGLLLGAIESVAVQCPDSALTSLRAFASAAPVRTASRPAWLVPVSVVTSAKNSP